MRAVGAVREVAAGGTGNGGCDVRGVRPLTLYRYRMENGGGGGNDDSQVWERADARALQVENSGERAASYVVPPFDHTNRPGFATPGFDSFILYQLQVGSFAGRNDGVTARNRTATFVDVIDKLSYIRDLGFNGIA